MKNHKNLLRFSQFYCHIAAKAMQKKETPRISHALITICVHRHIAHDLNSFGWLFSFIIQLHFFSAKIFAPKLKLFHFRALIFFLSTSWICWAGFTCDLFYVEIVIAAHQHIRWANVCIENMILEEFRHPSNWLLSDTFIMLESIK